MENNPGLNDETQTIDDGAGAFGTTTGYHRPGQPTWRDAYLARNDWIVWLLAGVVILGVVGCGALVFVFMNVGGETGSDATLAPVGAIGTPTPSVERERTAVLSATPFLSPTPTPTFTETPTPTLTPTATPTPTPTPDVILLGVKALGELNTVEYNLKTVVEKDVQQRGPLLLRPGLHFLLVAEGSVKAGVDFAEMVRYDIVDDKVTVQIPAPRITEYAVDPDSLEMYYINTGFGLDEKFAIEKYNEAVVEAQESLRRAALESDILEAARVNATALVQSLILGLGFSEVEVVFAPSGIETDLLEGPLELPITPAPFVTATPGE
jgi:hypothetical protein